MTYEMYAACQLLTTANHRSDSNTALALEWSVMNKFMGKGMCAMSHLFLSWHSEYYVKLTDMK